MRIATATLFEFDTPLISAVSLRRHHTIAHRRCFLIRMAAADGREGWGEASPLRGFSRETATDVASGFAAVRQRLLGTHVDDGTVDSLVRSVGAIPSLQFGLATALDALGERGSDAASGINPSIPTAKLLSVDMADPVRSAVDAVERGFTCLKIKVGRGEPVEEASRITQLIDAVDAQVSIRLDANRAWTLTQAATFLSGLKPSSIEFIEEPLRDPDDIEELVRTTGAPVAADESVLEGRLEALLRSGSICAVVVKPTLTGIDTIRRLESFSLGSGKRLVFSCSYECGVGTAAVARLAIGSDATTAAGLGTHAFLAQDVLRPHVDFSRPIVHLRDTDPGLLQIDLDRLKEVNLD